MQLVISPAEAITMRKALGVYVKRKRPAVNRMRELYESTPPEEEVKEIRARILGRRVSELEAAQHVLSELDNLSVVVE